MTLYRAEWVFEESNPTTIKFQSLNKGISLFLLNGIKLI